jgi:predicted DNA-binding transcriptional regulator YafY
MNKEPLYFSYVNWKGEVGNRKVIPLEVVFETNEFHGSEPLWLMKALDLDKNEIRYFDLNKINFK